MSNNKTPQYRQVIPRSIEELQNWYIGHNLPPEDVTRFFIGKNTYEPKAFGIYRDEGNFIVYKNKEDGSRAIRYKGQNEAYAVNELYLKLKESIAKQKGANNYNTTRDISSSSASSIVIGALVIFGILLILVTSIMNSYNNSGSGQGGSRHYGSQRGYYCYENDMYYYLDGDWYEYNNYKNDWYHCSVPYDLYENCEDYYQSEYYRSSYGVLDFEDTDYYEDWASPDSDSNWNSNDTWDSNSGDWDSDW